jgi:hypothetical protein
LRCEEVSEKFGCNLVDNNVDGLIVWSVEQLGSGDMSRVITVDS